MKLNLLLLFILVSCLKSNAQIVEKIQFSKIEQIFQSKNDTTYLINFWATWCSPCVEELPFMEKINQEYARKKLKVILVSMDMSLQLESKLIPFIKSKNIKSSVWLLDAVNANDWIDKISPTWSGAIPATIIVNTSKKLREFYEKEFKYEELNRLVLKAISE